LHGSALPDK
jgi:hypothetical protein